MMELGDLTTNELDALAANGIDPADFVAFQSADGGSGRVGDSKAKAAASADITLAEQEALVEINREFMIAMAYFNFALAVSGKINGR